MHGSMHTDNVERKAYIIITKKYPVPLQFFCGGIKSVFLLPFLKILLHRRQRFMSNLTRLPIGYNENRKESFPQIETFHTCRKFSTITS